MSDKKDRRSLDRYKFPGATVSYRKLGKTVLLKRYNGPYSLKDITKSSACFDIQDDLHPGTIVEMKIDIPHILGLRIKGSVVWCSYSEDTQQNLAVIQFLPFGDRAAYNSFNTRNKLKQLIENYKNIVKG